jgi:hypothetical protein
MKAFRIRFFPLLAAMRDAPVIRRQSLNPAVQENAPIAWLFIFLRQARRATEQIENTNRHVH